MTLMKDFLKDVEKQLDRFIEKHKHCPRCGIVLSTEKGKNVRYLFEQTKDKGTIIHFMCNGCNTDLTFECEMVNDPLPDAANFNSKMMEKIERINTPENNSGCDLSGIVFNFKKMLDK